MNKAWLFVLVMCLSGCGCEKINAGNVGLLINTTGDSRGVQKTSLVSGWVTYNAFTQDVVEFPTVVQTVLWEGAEAINFGSTEGVNISADVSMSFRIDPELAPAFYSKFKQPDLEIFAHGFLRNQVKSALNSVASNMAIVQIYGPGKGKLLTDAHELLRKHLQSDGVLIDELTFNSHLRLPDNVQRSINVTIEQTQQAEQARNAVATFEAQAQQQVAKAKGEAEAKRAQADADAFATLARAKASAEAALMTSEAQADGNKKIRESLTREIIDYEKVRRWNGVLPAFGGGGQLLVDLRSVTP